MLPTHRVTSHPGALLKRLFLSEMAITQKQLPDHTKMPAKRVNEICMGKRGITAQTAWLLSQALGTSPEFWMNAQAAHELTKNRPTKVLTPIKRPPVGQRKVA